MPHPLATPITTCSAGVKRSGEGAAPLTEKQARLAKYSLKFQSAGNLTTVGDRMKLEEGRNRGREYTGISSTGGGRGEEGEEGEGCVVGGGRGEEGEGCVVGGGRGLGSVSNSETGGEGRGGGVGGVGGEDKAGEEGKESSMKFSFGFSKKAQYHPYGTARRESAGMSSKTEGNGPVPPPLMSRRRELMTKAFGGDSDSEEEGEELVRMAVRGTPRFRFQIRK